QSVHPARQRSQIESEEYGRVRPVRRPKDGPVRGAYAAPWQKAELATGFRVAASLGAQWGKRAPSTKEGVPSYPRRADERLPYPATVDRFSACGRSPTGATAPHVTRIRSARQS